MADFSPSTVKYAARAHAAAIRAGDTEEMSREDFYGVCRLSFTYQSCQAEATIVDGAIVAMRVVDARGRHWFPEY